ncbi:hypothetical protein Dimus_022573, partial [Dionaea muscipula]
EFYAKMTRIHLKKKDVVKSSVKGISIEFDHERPVAILDAEECNKRDETFSKVYSFSGNEKCDTSIWKERHLKLLGFDIYGSLNGKEHSGVPLVIKKGEEPKKYDFFEDTFLTMCKPTSEDGIWWIGSGENRRRDDDEAGSGGRGEGEDEGNQKLKALQNCLRRFQQMLHPVQPQQKDKGIAESTLGSH